MSKVTTTWKDVREFLESHELNREQRITLLNYINKHLNAFPVEEVLKILPNGLILANGKQLSLEQREAFLTSAKSIKNNYAFNVVADQIVYTALKKGLQNSTELDHLHYTKASLYFIDELKRYIDTLDALA